MFSQRNNPYCDFLIKTDTLLFYVKDIKSESKSQLEKIGDDCSSGSCSLMAGLNLISVDVVPEYSLFGGWNGYSVELKSE